MRLLPLFLLASGLAAAQTPAAAPFFVTPDALRVPTLLPAPPANDSLQTREELKSLHQIGQDASPAALAAAASDAKDETVFLFAPALGGQFTPAQFPATAALFQQVAADADYFEKPGKKLWRRPRPYNLDTSLSTHCALPPASSFSYPSGHSTEAWTQATVLAALLPAKSDAIKARALQYAYEREICGVHYPSDVEAGHVLGQSLGELIIASPAFAEAAKAARAELANIK